MYNIIELRKEYLGILQDELCPTIYNGLHGVYNKCKQLSNDTTVLKDFQTAMKKICDWTPELKQNAVSPIQNQQKVKNLVFAIFKAEVMLLSNDYNQLPTTEITLEDYVHMVYQECAKELWAIPFLFYHKNTGLEINRNNYQIRKIIKECIQNSFRKMVPLDETLKSFLGEDLLSQPQLNISLLLQPVTQNKYINNFQHGGDINQATPINHDVQNQEQVGGNDEKILQIINDNIKLSDSPLKSPVFRKESSKHKSRKSSTSSHRGRSYTDGSFTNTRDTYSRSRTNNSRDSSSTLKKIINESINNNYTQETNHNSVNSEIKNHLMKDLESETLTYNPETNVKNYHDVFSNSEVDNGSYHNSINNTVKKKFINNYLTKN